MIYIKCVNNALASPMCFVCCVVISIEQNKQNLASFVIYWNISKQQREKKLNIFPRLILKLSIIGIRLQYLVRFISITIAGIQKRHFLVRINIELLESMQLKFQKHNYNIP